MSENENGKVIAFPKTLPKAQPLLPGEEEQETALMQAFNPNGLNPAIDMDDPDIVAAQQNLEKTIRRKALLKLAETSGTLDPDQVAELCRKEPWKSGPLEVFGRGQMGFVPERFEAAALQHPEGSEEYSRLMKARDEAHRIYWDQIKADNRRLCDHFQNDRSATPKRALMEPFIGYIYRMSREMIENPVWNGPGSRIFWIAHNLAPKFRELYGNDRGSGQNYTQWSLKITNDEPEPSA